MTYIDGQFGGMLIKAGDGGQNLVIGAIAPAAKSPDTIVGGAADMNVQGVGRGDILSLANQTGTLRLNAAAGDVQITLGSGFSTVFGGRRGQRSRSAAAPRMLMAHPGRC